MSRCNKPLALLTLRHGTAAVFWVILVIKGALQHDWVPELNDDYVWRVFPFTRWGHVMFDK